MIKFNIVKKALACVLSLLFLFFLGCSKLTRENYDKLEMGMDYKKVVEILGEADQCDGALGMKNCTWGTDTKCINVKFVNDKVILFSGKGL
ncbi:conserved hypothetical protein [uncultured Desulfobacterium sp.]|uniref:Lipoprotein n=1 Tax=uncultured Desulfobacterium sp. TaxID=201089 RepID=A0A445MSA3_9BACT|nr:conserved hypothetical protein [uncultured Desulfobacterium sp.]